ncbi:uncharacterized protein LOC112197545 [Rosa chinensis]|uniref:uncharacterized protein LOC112197545 n=1 Tax=Rosa chinensis TaxID=74649 RepID=UPI001AD8E60B|nr:uncharacterized protein LOC112197545 [Rosa chinensis]
MSLGIIILQRTGYNYKSDSGSSDSLDSLFGNKDASSALEVSSMIQPKEADYPFCCLSVEDAPINDLVDFIIASQISVKLENEHNCHIYRSCVKIKVGQFQRGIVLGINKLRRPSTSTLLVFFSTEYPESIQLVTEHVAANNKAFDMSYLQNSILFAAFNFFARNSPDNCIYLQVFNMNLSAPFICEFFKDVQEKASFAVSI